MGFPLTLAIRAVQAVFAIIILGLTGYGMDCPQHRLETGTPCTDWMVVANWYNVDTLTSSPSQVNFLLFASLFTLLSVVYLEAVPKFMPKCKYFAIICQVVGPRKNPSLTFSAVHHPWAVLSLEATNVIFYFSGFIALGVFLSNLLFCRGAVCGSARAATVFGSFEFALWCATAALTLKDAAQGGFSGMTLPGRSRGQSQGTMQFQQGGSQPMKEAAMAA